MLSVLLLTAGIFSSCTTWGKLLAPSEHQPYLPRASRSRPWAAYSNTSTASWGSGHGEGHNLTCPLGGGQPGRHRRKCWPRPPAVSLMVGCPSSMLSRDSRVPLAAGSQGDAVSLSLPRSPEAGERGSNLPSPEAFQSNSAC